MLKRQTVSRRQQNTAYYIRLNEIESEKNSLVFLIVLLFALCLILLFRHSRLKDKYNTLEGVNQSKDEVFGIVSHDLRSAVHIMQINISKIRSLLSQQMVDDAMLASSDTERIAGTTQSLLNNLLYWSQGQTGRINYIQEKTYLQPLINQVCYDFIEIAASKKIDLLYTVNDNVYCIGDVNSLKIILRNLIDNAIKFTPDQGIITISATQAEKHCQIIVEDSGIGMSPELISAVLAGDSKRVQQDIYGRRSTGIGFWLVKNLAEKNKGRLSVRSEPGKGTSIIIILPEN